MGDSEIYHNAVLMYVRYSGFRRQEQMMSHEAGYIYMPAVYYEFSKYSCSLTLGYETQVLQMVDKKTILLSHTTFI
jgi:hypothetical protein